MINMPSSSTAVSSLSRAFDQDTLIRRSSVGLINLGCARNLVDSQVILGRLKMKGHRIILAEGADVAIVNTCSFIEEARKESIDVILDLIDLKKKGKIRKIIVAGCLAQRYGKELTRELKGVDAFVGALALEKDKIHPQVMLTPRHFAYVKISESCYNQCSFCAIPKIKGKFVSRTIESVLKEVKSLDERGVKEINIIGQDITAYGMDIYREKSLARLLKEIASPAQNIQWIRLLYAFPAHVTDELIDVVAAQEKICPYIDIPLQHINDRILKNMNRGITKDGIRKLLGKIRRKIPQCSLRTTFIVGFPGESEGDFEELMDFVRQMQFERAAAFIYSREEDTAADHLEGHVPETVKKRRLNILMQEQQKISAALHQRFIGQSLRVLIDEQQNSQEDIYLGRSPYDAPEVDGLVYVHSLRKLNPGDFVDVTITDAYEYDLMAEL